MHNIPESVSLVHTALRGCSEPQPIRVLEEVLERPGARLRLACYTLLHNCYISLRKLRPKRGHPVVI